ncbi:hypothetical protein P152DRAFT_84239 [Eremomyces bilateralis CBS 781.70]|uniref:RING-type domain-containing protein n=1 Tax=Eremomyces bilateralis CBS 781.70 TaxID=1392243 RepID=A0A6G1FYF6_9PEZI|nr:uncharacterized protein P152DRAFT_84239 [Eremomyces bilateralis CBS 781.70]KAF1810823.1 hypothetical protein P152DRAFT_84239 [Eremomyces bilateralis CBS 781.70]
MDVCSACQNPLILEIEPDSDEEMQEAGPSTGGATTTVPDSVELLACGDKFHWQCLLDSYTYNTCPKCSAPITSTNGQGGEQLLVNLDNEGGLQANLDILPLLAEEAYLRTYPEERKPHAFLELCRGGDENLDDLIEMLQDDDEGVDEEDGSATAGAESGQPIDILRYQDTLGDLQTALHAAVASGSRRIVCLLLYLASTLDLQEFPDEVHALAVQYDITRPRQDGKVDIRSLKDTEGRTAAMLAQEMGDTWADGTWIRWLQGHGPTP